MAVVVHHALEESDALLDGAVPRWIVLAGASGVDVFFVISGFIMVYVGRERFGQPKAGRTFLTQRILRIGPLYWLCCLAIVVANLTGTFYQGHSLPAGSVLASLLLLPTDNLVLGVAWTLQYEMYFYTLFSLALGLLTVRKTVVVIPITLCLGVAGGHLLPVGEIRSFLVDPIVIEFAFGMWLAYRFSHERPPNQHAHLAIVAGLAGILASSVVATETSLLGATPTGGLLPSVRFLAWGVPSALIVFGALHLGDARTKAGRSLLVLGDGSYSIYLTHAIVMTCYARALKIERVQSEPHLVLPLLAVAVSIAVGLLTYRLVERPLNKQIKGITSSTLLRLPRPLPTQ